MNGDLQFEPFFNYFFKGYKKFVNVKIRTNLYGYILCKKKKKVNYEVICYKHKTHTKNGSGKNLDTNFDCSLFINGSDIKNLTMH